MGLIQTPEQLRFSYLAIIEGGRRLVLTDNPPNVNDVLEEYMDMTVSFHDSILINPFPNKPWFLHVCTKSVLKTGGKGEIARSKQFLLFE